MKEQEIAKRDPIKAKEDRIRRGVMFTASDAVALNQTVMPERITALFQFYHQNHRTKPFERRLTLEHFLESSGVQVYERWLDIGPELVLIDFGWIENPSWLLIQNEEGKHTSSSDVWEQNTLELFHGNSEIPLSTLRPRRWIPIPYPGGEFRIRSTGAVTRCTVYAMPE